MITNYENQSIVAFRCLNVYVIFRDSCIFKTKKETMATALSHDNCLQDEKDDLYSGHKVVAMPSSAFGGMSVRDVVSSQNKDYRDSTPGRYRPRSRSRSIGSRTGSRSRDIVQDVYDRMGVNYTRGRPSIENLLEDNKGLANQDSTARPIQPCDPTRSTSRGPANYEPYTARGRDDQAHSNYDRRPRSLSRGRLNSLWPPTNSESSYANVNSNSSTADLVILPTKSTDQKARGNYVANQRRSMPQPIRQSYPESREDESRDEGARHHEEEVDARSVDARSTVSVKSRISIYGAPARGGASTRSVRHSLPNQFPKRDYPKRIDIYGTEGQGARDGASTIAGSTDASDVFGKKSVTGDSKRRFSSANSVSNRSRKSGVANAFLAALSPNKQTGSPRLSKNVPIVEIPADEFHGGIESASLAASSVSGEDFSPKGFHSKKSHRIPFSVHSRSNGLGNDKLEKLVDERVQAQVAVLEKKFESEIRRIERRVEEEYRMRIEELEKKTDKVNSILSKILAKKDRFVI